MKPALLALLLVSLLTGCAHVARMADTLTVEGWAAVLRQREAAVVLVDLAEEQRQLGVVARCAEILAPALEIEARAWGQWRRGLWLGGLSYPDQAGQLPPVRSPRQADPGRPLPARSALELCAAPAPLVYLEPPREPG